MREITESAYFRVREITESERYAIVNALRVAAVEYGKDAAVHASLRDQFLGQTKQAIALAELIEGAYGVTVRR
jgi:hypothetical protein